MKRNLLQPTKVQVINHLSVWSLWRLDSRMCLVSEHNKKTDDGEERQKTGSLFFWLTNVAYAKEFIRERVARRLRVECVSLFVKKKMEWQIER